MGTCTNCGCDKIGCGCKDSFLTSPPPCPTPVDCPEAQPCAEVFDAQCIIYSGDPIICTPDVVVPSNTNIADALNEIVDYFCAKTPDPADVVIVQGDNISIDVTSITIGSTTTYTVTTLDTGWVDLEGFAYYQIGMATQKPQVRRMGKQIHFRGDLYLPLSDGTAIPLTTPDTYRTLLFKTPYIGAGGLINDGTDRLLFNSSGSVAQSVIPTSVLPALTNLDGTYKLSKLIATRQLEVQKTLGTPDKQGTLTLTAPVTLEILANKTLRITPVEVMESNSVDITSFDGSSAFRNITSSFTSRSLMTNLKDWAIERDGLHTRGGNIQTLGGLIIGRLYTILVYVPGDDFTNVGAIMNQGGQSFIATGTVPTSWVNSSQLTLTYLSDVYSTYPPNGNSNVAALPILLDGTIYLDAGDHTHIGGFKISLDGLIAYLT